MKTKQMLIVVIGLLLLLTSQGFAAQQAEYQWQNVTIGGGGFVSSVIAAPNDPGVFYARTDVGGAYRWDEGTQTWIPLLDWISADQIGYLGVDGIAVDPNVKGRVYMLLGIGYFNNGNSAFVRSDDYGETWDVFDVTDKFKAHGNGMGRGNGERIAVDPNNSNIILIGTRMNGLWKSTDRGESWTKLSLDYTPDMNRDMHESGVCTLQFDKTDVSGGKTQTIYAGVSRGKDNVYVSHNAGASWTLISGQPTAGLIRPQRIALTPSGRYLYVTYGNGAGPHPMLWSGVTDYFNRGAIYKYDTEEGTWTDVSPENFMENLDQITNNDKHCGAFSGISIDPNDENVILATAINSWRGPQYWNIDGTWGTWADAWGDNIYLSEDGGATWREMFRYYDPSSNYYPDYKMVDANGFPWIRGQAIHWNGAVAIDPFNSDRAFVVSGNGIFATDNLHDYYTDTNWVDNQQLTLEHGKATWKFMSRGIEETVPLDIVSPPGGPLVSVIADYDGFVHEQLDEPSPYGNLTTMVYDSQPTHLGTTTGVAYAAGDSDILVKASGNSATLWNQKVSICAVSKSEDGGITWKPLNNTDKFNTANFYKGKVALSADGEVALWSPMNAQSDNDYSGLFRYVNSNWEKCAGVDFSSDPEADQVDANLLYAYNPQNGYMYVSKDKGASFEKAGFAGNNGYKTARSVPGVKGDIWVPMAYGGLTRSTDAGQSFDAIDGVTWCEAVGFGKADSGNDFPTVFIYGTVDGVTGVFRSTDQGASWVRVNDDAHQYGGPGNASMVIGDMNVFGRVYMTTAGRGIVYGEPSGSTSPGTSVTGVTLTPASTTLSVGETVRLTATVRPVGATNKAVTWRSSKTAVATVSSTGWVTAVASGTATITVTTADGGYSDTTKVTVTAGTANTDPTAAISATPVSGQTPLKVNFSAAASDDPDGDALNYTWQFGDDSTATGVTAVHTYSTNGRYTATVTVEDGKGGSDTAAIEINVQDSPTIQYVLSLKTVGSGSISLTPAAASNIYDEGTEVTLTAKAATGYQFAGWSGDVTGTAATIRIVMDDTYTVTATFEPVTTQADCDNPTPITIPFSKDGAGQYCWVTTQGMAYIQNWGLDQLTINGVDYTATSWADDLPPAVNGKWVIYYDGKYEWSHFAAPQAASGSDDNPSVELYALSTKVVGSGNITLDPAGGRYEAGTQVTLTATAAQGYAFSGWSGDASGASQTITVTMDADKSVVATFTEVTTPTGEYTLTVTIEGNGSVTPAGGAYEAGTVVTLRARARSGYEFDGWSGDATGRWRSTRITMDGNKEVTATFIEEDEEGEDTGGCGGWMQ